MGDTVTLSLTPIELTLLQDLVDKRIAALDETYDRLRRLSEEADAFTITRDGEDANRLIRAVYAKTQRQIAQVLEADDPVAVLA